MSVKPVAIQCKAISACKRNNETELLVAAEFIINKLQRFEQFIGRYLNSHAPSIGTYARMFSAFNTAFENNMGNLLSAEQLATILKERIHPSNR